MSPPTTYAAIGNNTPPNLDPSLGAAQGGDAAEHSPSVIIERATSNVATDALSHLDASRQNPASGSGSSSSTRKLPAMFQNTIDVYEAQEQENESLRRGREPSDPLEKKRAYTSTNNPWLAAATTFLVKEPTRIFQENILKKNPFSDTNFSDLNWDLKSAIPSLFVATMKFVSSPLESCGSNRVSNWEKDLNDNVQAGNTGLVKRVASVVAHGILSSLKIARVVLAVLFAIGVTAAAIVSATGLALGLLGALVVTCPFWITAAAVAYKLNKEIADLKNDVGDLKKSHDPVVLQRANAQLGELVHRPGADSKANQVDGADGVVRNDGAAGE